MEALFHGNFITLRTVPKWILEYALVRDHGSTENFSKEMGQDDCARKNGKPFFGLWKIIQFLKNSTISSCPLPPNEFVAIEKREKGETLHTQIVVL